MHNKDVDILVISSTPDYMCEKLAGMGYKNVSTATVDNALKRLRENPPALMMMDYRIAFPGLAKVTPEQSKGTIPGIVFTTTASAQVDLALLANQHGIVACHSWDEPDVIEQLIEQAMQTASKAPVNLANALENHSKWQVLLEKGRETGDKALAAIIGSERYSRDL